MTRRPPPGKCVHCVKSFEEMTWDHIFPESWYPETTPLNMEKWKVPTCQSCNSRYGELERDLMIRIGLCLDSGDPNCRGIPQKAMRAIDPQFGRDEADKRARAAKRKEIVGGCFFGADVPKTAIYPGFGNVHGLPKNQQMALRIPAGSVEKLNEKIVRGIVFLEDHRFVESPFKVFFYAVDDGGVAPVVNLIKKYGRAYAKEPGIVVTRAVLPDDGKTSLYYIDIWNRFKMYAYVGKEANELDA